MRIDDFPAFQSRVKSQVKLLRSRGEAIVPRSLANGLTSTYVSCLMQETKRDRQKYIMDEYLEQLAATLDCDLDYLLGARD